jgi:ABC-type transporter Mla subunit MlaD
MDTKKSRALYLLEQIRKDVAELLLSSPTVRQINIQNGYLASLDDTLSQLADSQEALKEAAEALAEAVSKLQHLNLNADNIQVYGDEAKIWPRGSVHVATPSDDGQKPKPQKDEAPPGIKSLRKLQRLRKEKR